MGDKKVLNTVDVWKNIELENKSVDFLVGLSKKNFNRVLRKINRMRKISLRKQDERVAQTKLADIMKKYPYGKDPVLLGEYWAKAEGIKE